MESMARRFSALVSRRALYRRAQSSLGAQRGMSSTPQCTRSGPDPWCSAGAHAPRKLSQRGEVCLRGWEGLGVAQKALKGVGDVGLGHRLPRCKRGEHMSALGKEGGGGAPYPR